MPGGDRTGPGGMGPLTGRSFGYCGNASGTGVGRGGGMGGGRRRGWRNRFYATGLTGWQRSAMANLGPRGEGPSLFPPPRCSRKRRRCGCLEGSNRATCSPNCSSFAADRGT